jgi:REP element-mobilizing transposase RayT
LDPLARKREGSAEGATCSVAQSKRDGNRDGDRNGDVASLDGGHRSFGILLPMPRAARKAPGGQVYHVLNRAVGKMHLFGKDADFEAFQRVMIEAHQRQPIRILSYCVLSNHWHFAVWPDADGQMTAFFRWLAHTHAMRWRVAHRTVGYGHLYQGRFKSFPVQRDEHLLTVLRYIERNAVGPGWSRGQSTGAGGWKQERS